MTKKRNRSESSNYRIDPPTRSGRAVEKKPATAARAVRFEEERRRFPAGPRPGTIIVTCPRCDWSKVAELGRGVASLQGHIGAAHIRGEGKSAQRPNHAGLSTSKAGETMLTQFGTTKASKRNPVRLSDGKDHPVTVRRIGDPE